MAGRAVAAGRLDLLHDHCRGGQAQPAAAILFRDQRGEEAGLGERRDELGRIGALTVERAPIFARELGAEGANGLTDLCEIVVRVTNFGLGHVISNRVGALGSTSPQARLLEQASGSRSVVKTGSVRRFPGDRPAALVELYRIPRKYVAGTFERREGGAERALELLGNLVRRPAVGAMDGTNRARLIEQENLVIAHAENLAGNPLRAIRGEIDRKRRDLFRRHLLHAFDPRLFLRRLGRYRIDHACPGERRNAVRTHLEALHVERDAAGKPDDAELGRHVIGLAEIADQRRGRGHVHEGTAILLAEMRGAGPAHVEGTIEVDRQHVRPVRPAHAMEDAVAQNAGIVDQNVDAPECGERGVHDLLGILRLGDRERGGDRLASTALDLVHHLVRGRGIATGTFEARADVADDDAGALAGQQHGDGPPDAAPSAGDDRDLAGDNHPHTSSATSTMRRSFAHCSSSVSKLPSSVEAKPHWPEMHSCSSGAYFAAWSMRRLRSSLLSSLPVLVVTMPSTTSLPLGSMRSGSKPPERGSSYSMKYPCTLILSNRISCTASYPPAPMKVDL